MGEKKKTPEAQEKLIELRAKGWSYMAIAKEIGISKPTVINWARELKNEIANRKAFELEALSEKYYQQKAQQIETYGEFQQKIREEIEERLNKGEIEDLNTKDLFALFFEVQNRMEALNIEPKFNLPNNTDVIFQENLEGERVIFTPE